MSRIDHMHLHIVPRISSFPREEDSPPGLTKGKWTTKGLREGLRISELVQLLVDLVCQVRDLVELCFLRWTLDLNDTEDFQLGPLE